MTDQELFNFLEEKYSFYNQTNFIEDDPILIPHSFKKKQDIEISGFFAASLAWGQRKTIINKSKDLMTIMDHQPHDFVLNASDQELKGLLGFKHRTFNEIDLLYFVEFLKSIYTQVDSLEDFLFSSSPDIGQGLIKLKTQFESLESYPKRSGKHLASPSKGSACKRLNMYFRWMTRTEGVDFGIWKKTSPKQLHIPLDVHVQRVANKLGLIKSTKSNWKTCVELTQKLSSFDSEDPVKYDFALFGLGVSEKF